MGNTEIDGEATCSDGTKIVGYFPYFRLAKNSNSANYMIDIWCSMIPDPEEALRVEHNRQNQEEKVEDLLNGRLPILTPVAPDEVMQGRAIDEKAVQPRLFWWAGFLIPQRFSAR